MSIVVFIRHRHITIGLILLASLLLALTPELVHARVAGCRADPRVWLSDGSKLTIVAKMPDSYAEDIVSIVYTVHTPQGVTLLNVAYNQSPLGKKESVQVVDDLTGQDAYQVDTVVTTQGAGRIVQASGFATLPNGANRTTGNAEGETNAVVSYLLARSQ